MTLGIYAIHQPVIKLVRFLIETLNLSCDGAVLIAVLFVATLAITIVIYKLLTLNKYIAFLFLGKGLKK